MPYFKQYIRSSCTNHSGTTTLKQFVSIPRLGHQWRLTGINATAHCENEYLCVCGLISLLLSGDGRPEAATLNVLAGRWGESPTGFVFCL